MSKYRKGNKTGQMCNYNGDHNYNIIIYYIYINIVIAI